MFSHVRSHEIRGSTLHLLSAVCVRAAFIYDRLCGGHIQASISICSLSLGTLGAQQLISMPESSPMSVTLIDLFQQRKKISHLCRYIDI